MRFGHLNCYFRIQLGNDRNPLFEVSQNVFNKDTQHKDFSAYLIKAIIRYLQKKTEQRQKKFKYFLTRTMYYSMLHHNIDVWNTLWKFGLRCENVESAAIFFY